MRFTLILLALMVFVASPLMDVLAWVLGASLALVLYGTFFAAFTGLPLALLALVDRVIPHQGDS